MHRDEHISRRATLLAAAFATASSLVPGRLLAAGSRRVALPSAADIHRDYQKMVDFGPRLTGSPAHHAFVDWMATEFKAAGLTVGRFDTYPYRRWTAKRSGLTIEAGGATTAVPKISPFVRSASTGPDGVRGPLVYGGKLDTNGPANLPADLPKGCVLVFDAALPETTWRKVWPPHFVHLRGESEADVLDRPVRRLGLTPRYPLDALAQSGVAAVAIIMNVSSGQVDGNYSPHGAPYKPVLPVVFVGNDAGVALREAARARSTGHLTLDATWEAVDIPQITAILPGRTDEVMVIDTHTDGQNFIEENGCIALLHLARHFASLPDGERPHRTLVFAGFPGHMSGDRALAEATCWALAHPDLMKKAAAAFTLEHLGASEWDDIEGKGYGPTGHNEYMDWTATAGPMTRFVIDGIKRHDLLRHGVEHAPGFTTGRVFPRSGIPHISCICGPTYLLHVTPNGSMDKLDAPLAAAQTAAIAEMIVAADRVSFAALRAEDKTLGSGLAAEGGDAERK